MFYANSSNLHEREKPKQNFFFLIPHPTLRKTLYHTLLHVELRLCLRYMLRYINADSKKKRKKDGLTCTMQHISNKFRLV
jgi:hypothetical protein